MNWVQLLEAFLFAALVLPVLLAMFGQLTGTQSQTVMTWVLIATTVSAFMRDEYGHTTWCAALTVCSLLMLRRQQARKNLTKSPVSESRD
ncbi:hypothetical protein ACFYY1_39050 [Streptomyces sp. NPDC001890]|uniref:hypothetical protein n=1 Tax=Streptomyces sp. NPDC001890 TaxID=3364620 RepID=UPI00369B2AE4